MLQVLVTLEMFFKEILVNWLCFCRIEWINLYVEIQNILLLIKSDSDVMSCNEHEMARANFDFDTETRIKTKIFYKKEKNSFSLFVSFGF